MIWSHCPCDFPSQSFLLLHDRDLYIRSVGEGINRYIVELVQFRTLTNSPIQLLFFNFSSGERSVKWLRGYILDTKTAFDSFIDDDGADFLDVKEVGRGEFAVISLVLRNGVVVYVDDVVDFMRGLDTTDLAMERYFGINRRGDGDGAEIPF